ncbi:contractile injection system tape measure protein [Flavobacterium poyangense]|uniref:contractile injection system tape measure protein n=1 Tax=Flavobacterium poyangense TaxID=2204302 RepID=UPI00141F04E8|nr:contractile injection system tape measure protein [Flavobacterium sp. JXAS1]
MNKNKHSIQKVFLEIDTPSMGMANSIKNNLAVFIENELVPILEKQFEYIENNDNQIIQIEKLEISIQSDTGKNDVSFFNSETKNDIKNRIEKEIQKALQEVQKTSENKIGEEPEIRTLSSEDKQIKTLLYFIENGSMPWWTSSEEEKVFFEILNSNTLQNNTFKRSFQQLIHQKKVQKRIINQFSNYEIALLSARFLSPEVSQKTISENSLLKVLLKQSHEFKASFWQLIFKIWTDKKEASLIPFYYQKQALFLSESISLALFIQSIKAFFPLDLNDEELIEMNTAYLISEKTKPVIKPEASKTDKEKNIRDVKGETKETEQSYSDPNKEDPLEVIPKSEPEIPLLKEELIIEKEEDDLQEDPINFKSCYVQNAGLILLHPFLKEMLKSCHLIEDNNTLLDREQAAHILHYAATKRENDYEHTMLFEKFLCGIPLQQSIRREVKISDEHKQQVEEMLDSVVYHWSALKNTSTAVVRSEFLQREGKLDWSESNPKLTIERKTQDLLLEKIPWNISIVKIPWIEKLIYTQW